jgi:sortase A
VGIGGVAVWAASEALPVIWQDWAGWTFDREVAGGMPSVTDYLKERTELIEQRVEAWLGIAGSSAPAGTPHVVPGEKRRLIGPEGLIGRVTIPRLHLSAIVREGTSSKTLSLAAGHIPGTSLPGTKGNVAVAGHRDTLFRGLQAIERDDLIEFETLEGRFHYKVESTEVVKPEHVGVLNPGRNPELTLVTCYPFDYVGPAPDRFIVKAVQVAKEKADAGTWQEVSFQNAQRKKEAPKPSPQKINFSIPVHQSKELVPGISVGITDANAAKGRVYGWMRLIPDRRTMWLLDQEVRDPLVFYSGPNNARRELTITSVTENSVAGYLLLPE